MNFEVAQVFLREVIRPETTAETIRSGRKAPNASKIVRARARVIAPQ
jgi:hypothetical protein